MKLVAVKWNPNCKLYSLITDKQMPKAIPELSAEERAILDILKTLRKRDKFYANQMVSEQGQIPEDLFLKVDKKRYEAFYKISQNEAIQFDAKLLARHRSEWNWYSLLHNKGLHWNEELITEFYEEISEDLQVLSKNPSFQFSITLGEKYEKDWDWTELSKHKGKFWSEELIERFASKWDWDYLSANSSLPWSYKLIKRYAQKWDWEKLIRNENVQDLLNERFYQKYRHYLGETWLAYEYGEAKNEDYYETWQSEVQNNPEWQNLSTEAQERWLKDYLKTYQKHLDFEWFCRQKNFLWRKSLIDLYPKRWSWYHLSENPGLVLSSDLIERYFHRENKLSSNGLARNKGVRWTIDTLERLKTQIQVIPHTWEEFCENALLSEEVIQRFARELNWQALSRNQQLPWTEDFVAHFETRWHWQTLSENPVLPWSEAFIKKYCEKWHWGSVRRTGILPKIEGLPGNEGISWSLSLIHTFRKEIDLACLADSGNRVWQETHLFPYITEAVVRAYYA